MSTGAIFQLVTNDGKQDKMLMASQLLHKRLLMISDQRKKTGLDPTPTLADIEKTHILFVNAHFKPFVAIAYEYNKINAPGTITLGQKVDFNIAQFGDFFSDMVLHAKLTMSDKNFITATSDGEYGTWTDISANRWRWCNFPGERLLELVEFSVNGNPLDSYTPYVSNLWREYHVQPNKRDSWYRCVGQQLEKDTIVDNLADPGYLVSNADLGNFYDTANSDTIFTKYYNTEMKVKLTNGLQTPKLFHQKTVDLWIPLLFWFNTDFRLSIPSVAIPYGQRFISITLANANKLLGWSYRPIFDFTSTFTALTSAVSSGVVSSTPLTGSFSNDKLGIELTLYTNNIFVNPEIHEIFIRKISFNLIRVNKQQNINITKDNDTIWLNLLKWPIETLYVGLKSVDENSSDENQHIRNLDLWHTFTHNTYCQTLHSSNFKSDGSSILSTDVFSSPTITGAMRLIFIEKKNTLNTLSVSAHGIKFYDAFPSDFFNKYTPYRYGGVNINTPDDKGLHMINFCLYPGAYQPSGHVNVSRAREFYIEYNTSQTAKDEINGTVSSSNLYKLYIKATAINFLLISDGSAVLRYST